MERGKQKNRTIVLFKLSDSFFFYGCQADDGSIGCCFGNTSWCPSNVRVVSLSQEAQLNNTDKLLTPLQPGQRVYCSRVEKKLHIHTFTPSPKHFFMSVSSSRWGFSDFSLSSQASYHIFFLAALLILCDGGYISSEVYVGVFTFVGVEMRRS